jgi:hypothetical protein
MLGLLPALAGATSCIRVVGSVAVFCSPSNEKGRAKTVSAGLRDGLAGVLQTPKTWAILRIQVLNEVHRL